jgi:glycine oxidase
MSLTSDAVIVGGGVIGTALAWELARRGLSITLVESGLIGRGASWAAAGVLARSDTGIPALTALVNAGVALWPDSARAIEEQARISLGFRRDGVLRIWIDPTAPHLPSDLDTAPPCLDWGQRLSPDEARELEPALTGPIAGAHFDPDAAQVENPRLAPRLAHAASTLGVRFLTDAPVAELLGSHGRCTGVRTAAGVEISAGFVIVAAGAWSGSLARASGIQLPVEPWRGQMLAFDAFTRPVRHVIFSGDLVMVPRAHGPLVVGTTFEHVGFDARVTLAGLSHILNRVERVAPGLGGLPLIRSWAGLRPGTPDQLPYLGPVPGWEGLFCATGHGRKGIALAPLTAQLLTRLVLDHALDPLLVPCLPSRVLVPCH